MITRTPPPPTRKSNLMDRMRCTTGLLMALLLVVSGCADAVDPQIQSLRQKFLLESAPSEETSVSKVLKSLQPPEPDAESETDTADDTAADSAEIADDKIVADVDEVDVVLKGRIYAGENSPWVNGMAAFVLTDATGHEGESDHDPHTCPFCSRKINDYLAQISFVNDNGDLIEIDSRKLFDVKDKQLVFVQGKGRIDEYGLLSVTASGLYLPP